MPNRKPRKHGTWAEYNNHGCRCQPCIDAQNAQKLKVAHRAKKRFAEGTFTGRHGTIYAVRAGCRCGPCEAARLAELDRSRERRQKRRNGAKPAAERRGVWDESGKITVSHWPRWDENGRWTCPECGEQFEVASNTPQRNAA